MQSGGGFTPTPSISHAILTYNRGRPGRLADGIVITPSHNPPEDGGFKYNPPNGGPADTDVTGWIQDRANGLLRAANREVRRIPYDRALAASTHAPAGFRRPLRRRPGQVVDLDAIRAAGIKLRRRSAGRRRPALLEAIAARYGLDLTVINRTVDPRFAFMTLDHDGKIRMDCSSPYAMAKLVELRRPVPGRLRQRRRRRPPRHRRAVGRA